MRGTITTDQAVLAPRMAWPAKRLGSLWPGTAVRIGEPAEGIPHREPPPGWRWHSPPTNCSGVPSVGSEAIRFLQSLIDDIPSGRNLNPTKPIEFCVCL